MNGNPKGVCKAEAPKIACVKGLPPSVLKQGPCELASSKEGLRRGQSWEPCLTEGLANFAR
jgi:hypothetical protein